MARVCLVCISLRAGGTEKVVSALANHFVRKHEVDVVLMSDTEPFYELEPGVKLWQLGSRGRGLRRATYYVRALKFIRSLAKERKPDVVLSFGELISPFVKVSMLGLPPRIFVFNRGSPYRSMRGVSGWLNPVIYPFADGIVVQTSESLRVLKNRYKFCRLIVIPNPIELPLSTPAIHERRKVIVNVGSIGRLKNQGGLILAFGRSGVSEEWELHFVGDGPDRARLEAMAKELGLDHRIRFLGERSDVSEILSHSQVFAFTSLSEGFPNALGEALAHGCACISFDCPTGPSDLIRSDVNGILVPMGDEHRYIEELRRLLNDEELRRRFSDQAKHDMQKYSFDSVVRKFEDLVSDANR